MQKGTEKEWYYGNKERERLGPFSFKEVSASICNIIEKTGLYRLVPTCRCRGENCECYSGGLKC